MEYKGKTIGAEFAELLETLDKIDNLQVALLELAEKIGFDTTGLEEEFVRMNEHGDRKTSEYVRFKRGCTEIETF